MGPIISLERFSLFFSYFIFNEISWTSSVDTLFDAPIKYVVSLFL